MSQYWRHFLLAASCSTIVACGAKQEASATKEAWNKSNAPEQFNLQQMKLEDLPLEGMLSDEAYPWSDDYWGTYAGGISARWQNKASSRDYRKHLYDFVAPREMSENPASVEIAKLSPAEKYDLWMGQYDFPLARHERMRMLESVDPQTDSIPGWFGLCHGWAPATLMEPEAGEVAVVKNKDGLEIPFYTSDIKGLISKIYSDYAGAANFAGERCNIDEHGLLFDENGRVIQSECRDMNPGTLHLALGQMLGKENVSERQGFILDVTVHSEVWNQPVTGYTVVNQEVKEYNRSEDKLAKYRAKGTAYLATIKTEVYYGVEIAPHAEPMKPYRDSYTETMNLEYVLELDKDGKIIGGEWVSQERPDFMWMLTEKPDTRGSYLDYGKVRELLDLSRTEAGRPE